MIFSRTMYDEKMLWSKPDVVFVPQSISYSDNDSSNNNNNTDQDESCEVTVYQRKWLSVDTGKNKNNTSWQLWTLTTSNYSQVRRRQCCHFGQSNIKAFGYILQILSAYINSTTYAMFLLTIPVRISLVSPLNSQ